MIWNSNKECMSRDELSDLQGKRLHKLVELVYHNTPFYRKKMQEMDLLPDDIQTIEDIEKFLGYHRWTNAVIIGAGGLGRAILAYEGFENYGIHVIAAFDASPSKVGAAGGKPIYPMERLSDIAVRNSVKVAILTVPRSAAQAACDEIVRVGITAILNFAPVYLHVPDGVKVKYEDLAVSLAGLCGE